MISCIVYVYNLFKTLLYVFIIVHFLNLFKDRMRSKWKKNRELALLAKTNRKYTM